MNHSDAWYILSLGTMAAWFVVFVLACILVGYTPPTASTPNHLILGIMWSPLMLAAIFGFIGDLVEDRKKAK